MEKQIDLLKCLSRIVRENTRHYLALTPAVGKETAGWLCILAAAPIAAAGFFRYNGMTFGAFLWAFVKSELLCAGKRGFAAENYYYDLLGREERDDFD